MCLPPVPILNQIDPVHSLICPFLKIHLNIILPSTTGSSKRSPSLRFPHQTLYTSLLSPHMCYMLHPPHSSIGLVQIIFTPPNSKAMSVDIPGLMESYSVNEHYFGCKNFAVVVNIQLRFLYKVSQIVFQLGLLPVMSERNITINVGP